MAKKLKITSEPRKSPFFVRLRIKEYKKTSHPSIEDVETWKWKKVTNAIEEVDGWFRDIKDEKSCLDFDRTKPQN